MLYVHNFLLCVILTTISSCVLELLEAIFVCQFIYHVFKPAMWGFLEHALCAYVCKSLRATVS